MRNIVVAAVVLLHYSMADSNSLPISQASNAFASQLYQELAKTPGNVLVCPLSVHIALALVHQGADGTTRDELTKALHLENSNVNIKNNYKELLTGLQDDVLKIATKLYPAISFTPKPEYISLAQQYFLSDVQALDYNKNVDAANIINKFVENKTNNKIHDIIKPDSLSDLTRLVVVNAVHFKANWAKTFPPSFTDDFKVTPSQSVKTGFLRQTDYFPFKADPVLGAKILKMDYEGGKYSMVFVLPNKEDGLPELEAKLASTSMDNLLSGLKESRVDVTIPKFKIEKEMQLKEILLKMGIMSLFDSRANLSNMAGGENLYVDSVIQKTFIDVNEKGTEAAAATGIITPLSGGSEDYTFIAQRPFHYYLIHNKIPVILFNGRLVKPKEKTKTPLKERDNIPTDKDKDALHYPTGNDRDENRLGNEHGTVSNNHGIGMNPGQNLNQQNSPQKYGLGGPINRINPNKYAKPQPPQSNYVQYNQQSTGQGQNIDQQRLPPDYSQNSQAVSEHNRPSYHQAGNLNSGQNKQPIPQQSFASNQPFGAPPTGQPQYQGTYYQPNGYPQRSNYQPQSNYQIHYPTYFV